MVFLMKMFGRLLLGFFFLHQGFLKIQSFQPETGGPILKAFSKKFDVAQEGVLWLLTKTGAKFANEAGEEGAKETPTLLIPKSSYKFILGAMVLLELGGGLLLIVDKPYGAHLLLLVLLATTLITHNYWTQEVGSRHYVVDLIHFYKNVALMGALMMYLGMRSELQETKEKLAYYRDRHRRANAESDK